MKMLDDRMIAIQRRQMTQVTIFEFVFIVLNWIVLGKFLQKPHITRTPINTKLASIQNNTISLFCFIFLYWWL